MEDNSTVIGTYVFRGVEYIVTMKIENGNSLLVEVEDRLTADQWRGTFDQAYIEELTRKTGNFKQFGIFASMMESALTQNSDSVSLDLLTYADLESLRNRKTGANSKAVPNAGSSALSSRRYLILTYTVEFDRIHYPLPLPYTGKPDPQALQATIRELQQEITTIQSNVTKDLRQKDMEKLRKDYAKLKEEKIKVETTLLEYKREVQNTNVGGAVKEIRMLKEIVKNLEQELLQEKMKRQRGSSRRSHEMRQLMEEMEEMRASERNLKVRVKNMTNELAVYKRNNLKKSSSSHLPKGKTTVRAYMSDVSSRENSFNKNRSFNSDIKANRNLSNGVSRGRSNSRDRAYSKWNNSSDRLRQRSTSKDRDTSNSRWNNSANRSRERSLSRDRDISNSRFNSSANRSRERSLSRDRDLSGTRDRRNRSSSLDRVRPPSLTRGNFSDRESSGERIQSFYRNRTRTPSPAGGPRFDPTAYVKEKERLKKEASLKQKQGTSRNSRSTEKKRSTLWSGRLAGSQRSRTSSLESLSDAPIASFSSDDRSRRIDRDLKSTTSSQTYNGQDTQPRQRQSGKSKKLLSSTPESYTRTKRVINTEKEIHTPDADDSDYFDRSTEISEIDARLNRLQQFMENNLT